LAQCADGIELAVQKNCIKNAEKIIGPVRREMGGARWLEKEGL
jgi:hypothetical protein